MDPLAYLFSLEQFGIKFGLENIRTIAAELGHPERAFRSIHIAGTNGKGSATAMIDTVLRSAGYRSARYTSPHLVDLSERFVIDGRPVERDRLALVAGDVQDVVERLRRTGALDVQPTFFEVTTAIAFELFRRAGVDVAVLEVGLGGRLDATNVIPSVAAAITSIAFDHERYLGSTLAEIAVEKAGIIKPGVPVVVGDIPHDALEPIARIARELGAELVRASEGVSVEVLRSRPDARRATGHSESLSVFRLRTPARDYGELRLALNGTHQVANAVVAVRVLETLDRRGMPVSTRAIADGLATVSWPGRLEHRVLAGDREIVLDAAHNPAGAAALARYLGELGGEKPPLVFAAMRDKDVRGMLRALAPTVAAFVMTRASNRRAADPDALAEEARLIAPEVPVQVARTPGEALAAAWARSPHIVVAGSIFLLGDVMQAIDEQRS